MLSPPTSIVQCIQIDRKPPFNGQIHQLEIKKEILRNPPKQERLTTIKINVLTP